MDKFGKCLLCPAPRRWIELVREDTHGNRDGDAFGIKIAELAPILLTRRSRYQIFLVVDCGMKTETLVERHAEHIYGVLECFDRVILGGTYRAIGWPAALGQYLHGAGIGLEDFFKEHANSWRLEVAKRVRAQAKAAAVEVRQVQGSERKEDIVAKVLAARGEQPGVVCVLGAMERCRSFRVRAVGEQHWLQLQWDTGRCEHF